MFPALVVDGTKPSAVPAWLETMTGIASVR
jgi:hypothetical protein